LAICGAPAVDADVLPPRKPNHHAAKPPTTSSTTTPAMMPTVAPLPVLLGMGTPPCEVPSRPASACTRSVATGDDMPRPFCSRASRPLISD